MSRARKVTITLFLISVFALAILTYALFHGYFDQGDFEIEEVKRSDRALVAMVARRSDHEALSGDQYFVLIGPHVYSPTELRHAYYKDSVIFRADSPCLGLSWSDPGTLTVSCSGGAVVPSHIAIEKHRAGDVKIIYTNIPEKMAAQTGNEGRAASQRSKLFGPSPACLVTYCWRGATDWGNNGQYQRDKPSRSFSNYGDYCERLHRSRSHWR